MGTVTKCILTILAMLAVMGYTIVNYMSGKTDFVMFVVCLVILGIPMINMINILIQELKKR